MRFGPTPSGSPPAVGLCWGRYAPRALSTTAELALPDGGDSLASYSWLRGLSVRLAAKAFAVLRSLACEDYGHSCRDAVQRDVLGGVNVEVFATKALPHRKVVERSKLLLLYDPLDSALPG